MFPKLRFKEFDENWKEVTLKNCITSIDSGWSPQCESYPANSSEWGVLKTTSVDWSGFNSSFNKKLPLELTPRKEIEVKPLDILVTRAGPTERVGVVSVVPHSVRSKLMISDKLIRLKSNEENNPLFLGISLSSVKCQNQLQSKTSGLAKSQTNISQKILGEVLLKLPSKEEQTKIASFLSAVDEKISQLTKKHELLSQYKQGMMQKLFSQQIRFKADDGSEFGEWEETTLEKIGTFLKGKGISKADIVCDGQIPCVRYGELYTHYGEVISKVISATNIDVNNLVLSKANDILIPASGETQIDIATASCILDDGIALSGDLNIFRTKENGIFLSYLIRSKLKMKIAWLRTSARGIETDLEKHPEYVTNDHRATFRFCERDGEILIYVSTLSKYDRTPEIVITSNNSCNSKSSADKTSNLTPSDSFLNALACAIKFSL